MVVPLQNQQNSIAMADIYEAVREKQFLGKSINEPNPACAIGRQINEHLDDLYLESERGLMRSLQNMTLAEFLKKFS